MSISLNDHEDRIRVLENTSHKVKPVITKLIENWHPTSPHSTTYIPEILNYEFAVVIMRFSMYSSGTSHKIFSKFGPKDIAICYNHNQDELGSISAGLTGSEGSDVAAPYELYANGDMVTSGRFYMTVYGVNLKLYYSFSYNIIYRATHLLEKIFYVLNKGGVSV